MDQFMVNIYVNLIKNTAVTGKTIADVPEHLRAAVLGKLNESV